MILFLSVIDLQPDPSAHAQKVAIDESIFTRIANDDLQAFEEFYRLTERILYAFILSVLRDHEDTLDVLQETYIKVRGAAHLYKPMGKPMAWVFTIARNLSMSRLRSKKYTDSTNVEDIENDISFSYVTDHEDRLVLQSALKILGEEEREIILLHAISGFTHLELSKSLDMPLSTVLSKYHRGLKKLRKHLQEKGVLK